MHDYEAYDGLGLAALVRQGDITPTELLEAAITRIEARDPTVNAIVTQMFNEARAAIQAGLPEGPFRGVPFFLKDLTLAVPGVRTAQGSALFQDYVPDYESALVSRYRQAGLVLAGKAATSELGLAPLTETRLFGATRNPWNPDVSPGGSSGGSAAAVAAGYAPMANAIDGGGSIRIPAAWCGLFGLKPTRVRTPEGPQLGLNWSGLGSMHAVTRSVRDSAALLDVTQGADIGAPFHTPWPKRPYREEVQTAPGSLRIARALDPLTLSGIEIHPDCLQALEQAVKLCLDLGHSVEEFHYEIDWEEVRNAARLIVATEVRVILEQRAHDLNQPLQPEHVEPDTWRVMEAGLSASAADYLNALNRLHLTGRQFSSAMQGLDAIITPTVPMPPVDVGMMSPFNAAGATARRQATGYTQIANITGNPAMSVPLYWNDAGLPVGIHFIGQYGDEATLFRLAGQLEQAEPWFHRRPTF